MCDDEMESVTVPPSLPAADPPGDELARLSAAVAALQRELVELRMGQRKALLEELAALENPLVEQGVLTGRTRQPRHGR